MTPRLIRAGLPRNETATFIKLFVAAVSTGDSIPQQRHVSHTILAAAVDGFHVGSAEAAQLIYYVTIAFGGAAFLLSLALPTIGKYMTDRVISRRTAVRG